MIDETLEQLVRCLYCDAKITSLVHTDFSPGCRQVDPRSIPRSVNAVVTLAEAVPDFEQFLRLLRRAVHYRYHFYGIIPGVGRKKPFPVSWDTKHAQVLSRVVVRARMNGTAGRITRAKGASQVVLSSTWAGEAPACLDC